jgi:DNA-binding beta-propeller fold protein YncE
LSRRGLGLLAVGLLTGCSPAPRRIAVATTGDPAVLVFTPDLTRADTLPLDHAVEPGEHVWDVRFAPDGASLWVVLAGDTAAALLQVRRTDGAVLQRIPVTGGAPSVVTVLPNARAVLLATGGAGPGTLHFIPTDGSDDVARVQPCTGPVRGAVPFDVLDELYVACGEDAVAELDTELRVVVRTVPLAPAAAEPGCGASDVALSSNGTIIYVLCRRSGTLLYLDRVRLSLLDSVGLGEGAAGLHPTPGRRRAVVTRPGHDESLVVDFRRREAVARLKVPAQGAAAVSSNGRWAYLAARGAVVRIDLRTGAVDASAETPSPIAVDVWPGHRSPVMRWH